MSKKRKKVKKTKPKKAKAKQTKKKISRNNVQKWEARYHQMRTLKTTLTIALILASIFFFLSIRELIINMIESWTLPQVPSANNNETITILSGFKYLFLK